ncbi:helix-turn-helix transcriptional regulator [Lacticaseibacillus daqingensis]|uniref:helix-turn-helix transcriptional regulator n=1 Tax=Lacticaseibacillus daqingensis TaxID=2486014 RepID=UPI000F7AE779|nr:WYL domain-containing protein [Lacticaseibacillus daqingensis]
MATGGLRGSKRTVMIMLRLFTGAALTKTALASEFQCSESSVQRDIREIRAMIAEAGLAEQFQISTAAGRGTYQLKQRSAVALTPTQRLAVGQILLASRGLSNTEMAPILQALLGQVEAAALKPLLQSDWQQYRGVPDEAAESVLATLAVVVQAIREHARLRFTYTFNGQAVVLERVPTAVFFADLYFFMTSGCESAYDDLDVTRLHKFALTSMTAVRRVGRAAAPSQAQRLETGRLRQHTALPFLGNPVTLVIDYFSDPQYVRDRFPQAKQLATPVPEANWPTWPGWTQQRVRFAIEVNDGYGIRMWLLQQAHMLKVIEPTALRDYVITRMQWTLASYGAQ